MLLKNTCTDPENMNQHSRCALCWFSISGLVVVRLSSTPLCLHDELGVLLFAASIHVTFASLKVFIPRVFALSATRKQLWD